MKKSPISVTLICAAILLISCGNDRGRYSGSSFDDEFWYSGARPFRILNSIIAERTMVLWSTGGHTAQPVPIGSAGPEKYTSRLNGIIPNTRIAEVLKQAVNERMNVILVIGDGMGSMHMSLPVYLGLYSGREGSTAFEKIMKTGRSGLCLTNPWQFLVTDSAAAATAIACGEKTRIGMIGMDRNGRPLESVLEVAEKRGMPTGLVTDTRITHATPAGFYATALKRNNESMIAAQLVDNYDIEVLMGGGAGFFVPSGTRVSKHKEFTDINPELDSMSERKDSRDLVDVMKKKGYSVVSNKRELKSLAPGKTKILGLFAGGHMNSRIDRDNENTGEPSIVEMTEHSLSVLSRSRKGFFMMVECGRLDHDAHDNDTGAVAHAVSEMNQVLEKCYSYYNTTRGKTLLVFTADHETGGLGLTYLKSKKKRYSKDLPGGQVWNTSQDSMDSSGISRLFNQTRSLRKIISMSGSPGELREIFKKSTGISITGDEAEIVYAAAEKVRKKRSIKSRVRNQREKSR